MKFAVFGEQRGFLWGSPASSELEGFIKDVHCEERKGEEEKEEERKKRKGL